MSKQDKSPKVTQRGKLTTGLNIKDLKWTKKQQRITTLAPGYAITDVIVDHNVYL